MLTELDKPRNGEPSTTNLIWISGWLTPLVIIYKLPLRFFKFNFLRIMVYTVITGFIELPYEHTLVPGVLITNPKKIPSIWKDKDLHPKFVLFDNYSQTNLHFDILSIKEVFGGHQWNFWRVSWSNVFSFRLERQWLSGSKRKDPNITALKSKRGICTSLSSPLPCTSSKSCAHSGKYSNFS